MKIKINHIMVFAPLVFCFLTSCGGENNNKFSNVECDSLTKSGYKLFWCYEPASIGRQHEVLYYFHGIESSHNSWLDHSFRRAMQKSGGVPHVYSISFGPRWFLTDVPGFLKKSRLETFNDDFLPYLEKRIPAHLLKRYVVGESMGGYNALRFANFKSDVVDKVIAFCPALSTVSPYSSPVQISEFVNRNPAVDLKVLFSVLSFAVLEFPLPQFWSRNSPLELSNSKNYTLPPLFITSNKDDLYGFNEGTQLYASNLQLKGLQVQHYYQDGPHCQNTTAALNEAVDFLNQ